MSYYNRYRNRKRFEGGSAGSAGSPASAGSSGVTPSDAIFDLGKNKRVTVRQFRNVNLIDIREYYMDTSTGDMRPGKKGISLTEDLYDELLKHRLNIDEALRRLGSKRPRTKTVRLLSDDEDDGLSQQDVKEKVPNSQSSTAGRSGSGKSDEESPRKRKKPAPPTLLPQEEKKKNDEREAKATLIVPGANKKQQADVPAVVPEPPAPAPASEQSSRDQDASDEEFVQNLEAEMNKVDEDVSEED